MRDEVGNAATQVREPCNNDCRSSFGPYGNRATCGDLYLSYVRNEYVRMPSMPQLTKPMTLQLEELLFPVEPKDIYPILESADEELVESPKEISNVYEPYDAPSIENAKSELLMWSALRDICEYGSKMFSSLMAPWFPLTTIADIGMPVKDVTRLAMQSNISISLVDCENVHLYIDGGVDADHEVPTLFELDFRQLWGTL